MTIPPRPTELAHAILRGFLQDGDIAVDATAGNGHDTVFLARLVGTGGRVIAYDIQEQALARTKVRLDAEGLGERVLLRHASHSRIADDLAAGSAAAVMFNLGYLPGDDRQTVTETAETLSGIKAATRAIRPGGALSMLCYPGHPGGDTEAAAVESLLRTMARDEGWRVGRYGLMETTAPAPFLLVGRKPCP